MGTFLWACQMGEGKVGPDGVHIGHVVSDVKGVREGLLQGKCPRLLLWQGWWLG